MRPLLVPALVALGAALLYLPQLRDAPFYLNRDEMFSGLTGHSMASTGRDTTGRFMPLYFQTHMRYGSEMWFQPMLMYAITFSVKVLGLSEGSIRLPMALAGVVDVVLVYVIGRLLFDHELFAVAAAVLLALTPAHFIQSRVAMDFQAPLPFMLGWLLCVLMYLRRGHPSLLFAAGLLLGIGLYTYIAAYMLMPSYALLTCVVLYLRREPFRRYATLAAGCLLPALCCVPFLLRNPTVIHDIFWHYERDKPQSAGALDLFFSHFNFERCADAASLYWHFWNPRFLFINGPQSMWVAGAFLLPAAGLLAVGVLHALRRPVPYAVLLLGGLLIAPVPASLVGDGEAIHRASGVLPFGVLLAIVGLHYLWTAESSRARSAAFVAIWTIPIGLAAAYHDELPLAQALVRASTVPMAVAGLYVLSRQLSAAPFRPARFAVVACVTLIAMQVAYFVLGYPIVAWASLVLPATIGLVMHLNGVTADRLPWPAIAAVLLAAASSHFMYAYADYSHVHRVQFIPASAILLAVRLVYASCALATMVGVALLLERVAVDRPGRRRLAAVAAVTIVLVQVAYFYIDYFTDYRMRFIHATAVLAAAGGVAVCARSATAARIRLGQLTVAALFGLVSIQFVYFHADYFTRYRVRAGNGEPEGIARVAWETVIDRARVRSVPAIYLGKVGPYGFSDLYWTFYAIEHHREDLLARTISDVEFDPDRVRRLPNASLVVTSPSPQTDVTVERMLASGELREKTLVAAPDGTSRFWVLETGARAGAAVP